MSVPVWSQPQRLVVFSNDGEWTSGICDCCDDMRECCFAFWCCPCFACKTAKAYGQCLCLPLLDIFSCVNPIAMSMRASIRQRYGIRGSLCRDFLFSACCTSCVWCQMSREIKSRKLPTVLSDLINR